MAAVRLDDLRVVLLGKTGAGKSSTGNTLLGRDAFRVARGLSSGTEKCQWADEEIADLNVHLQVTDTPGVSDTHRKEDDVLKEVAKSIAVASPGPHVVLMVLRSDARFTQEEYMAYVTLKQLFGDDVKDFMVLVFVGIDSFNGDTLEENRRILAETLRGESGNLRTVLDDAGGRVFGITNKAPKEDKQMQRQRQRQARDLVNMMMELKRQHGDGDGYFKNKLSNTVADVVRPMVKDRMAQGNVTEREAVRQTNIAIVEETSGGFMDWLERTGLPMLKQGLRIAVDVVKTVVTEGPRVLEAVQAAKDCAVM